jgi:7-cyano-7-deazaguanine synthase
MKAEVKKAIVLLSGGLDSTTVLAIAKSQGFVLYALSFDYEQRHKIELDSAKALVQKMDVDKHKIIEICLHDFGASALTDKNIDVPKSQEISNQIPITYVPARNSVFLSYALAWAEVIGCFDVFIGVNQVDYSGYPDCRPEYIQAFQAMANLATKAGVEQNRFRIHAPLIDLSKGQIIATGLKLGVDYGLTFTCYDPNNEGLACGQCDSCMYRLKGFREAGVDDPIQYVKYAQEESNP